MRELWFWRVVAVVALFGWGLQYGRGSRDDAPPSPSTTVHVAPADGEAAHASAPVRRSRFAPPLDPDDLPAATTAARPIADGPPIPEEVMERARAQVFAELRAQREAHADERLDDALARVGTFAEEHKLTEAQQESMVAAVLAMHERMRALHANDDGPPGPPSPEHRDQMRASFQQLDSELRTAIGDDLADAWRETFRGPPGG